MSSSSSTSAVERLLFNWEPPRRQRATITAFLAISLVAHALCFYVFQIVYPPPVALLPPPVRVSVIASNSEGGRTLLRWIEAEDPALAFMTHRPPEARIRALPNVKHIPSYHAAEPALKQVAPLVADGVILTGISGAEFGIRGFIDGWDPAEHSARLLREQKETLTFMAPLVADLRIPSSQAPGPVSTIHRTTAPNMEPAATTLSFSKELDGFGAANLPASSFAASNDQPPANVRFRVAVSGSGEIRYCFPLNSSGDPALDEQARRDLALCRFSKSPITAEKIDRFLVWGVATVEWGTDVARPRATPTAAVTP